LVKIFPVRSRSRRPEIKGKGYCRNPSFGLATKARGCKVAEAKKKEARESKGRKLGSKGKGIGRVRAKRRKPGSHHILPRV
jgi:hypothetical protein